MIRYINMMAMPLCYICMLLLLATSAKALYAEGAFAIVFHGRCHAEQPLTPPLRFRHYYAAAMIAL